MVLEEFRKIDLTWDKATRRIYDAVRVASSDENGRKLVVQVLNDGQVEDLSGTSLHLYWKTANEKNKGLDPFEEVDPSKGIFQIYFTTEMASNVGILTAHLHLADDQGVITSEPFKISVFEGVDNDAVESSDSFSSLTKILIEATDLEKNYAPQLTELKQSDGELTAQLAQTVQDISQVTQKITQVIPIDIISLGADPTGVRDSTQAFRTAIRQAYDMSLNSTGWRSPKVLRIPSGEYLITDTLIDPNLNVTAGRFVFEGDGQVSTSIVFSPSTHTYMFDNDQIFGFTSFKGLTFYGNNIGSLFKGAGGGSGNAQSFIFEDCHFMRFHKLLDVTGNTMMSEITFRDCKISSFNEDSIIFSLANPQAVNWRFHSVDIEGFEGILFQFHSGNNITFFQGSVIPMETGTIVDIPEDANANHFGTTNAPHLQMYGTRLELRGRTHLFNIRRDHVGFVAVFNGCGMGGYNLPTDPDFYVMETTGRGSITFNNCHNLGNYKHRANVTESSDYTSPLTITFNQCDIGNSFIKNSVTEGISNNHGSAPNYRFIGCGIQGSVRGFGHSAYNSYRNVTKKTISFNPSESYMGYTEYNNEVVVFEHELPQVQLLGIRFSYQGISGFDSIGYTLNIYDQDRENLLLTGHFISQHQTIIETDENFNPYNFNKEGGIQVEFIPDEDNWYSGNINVNAVLELEY